MSYADLPLEERMSMATDFVLLLIDEERPLTGEAIVRELRARFALTPDQAVAAYVRSRSVHGGEVKRLQRRQLLHGAGAVLVLGMSGIFYLALGSEVSGVFSALGVLFLLLLLGGLAMILKLSVDHFFFAPRRLQESVHPRKKRQGSWASSLFGLAFVFLLYASWNFFGSGEIVDPGDLITYRHATLQEPPRFKKGSGRSERSYFGYRFVHFPNEFRFWDEDYNWAPRIHDLRLRAGDTLSVQLLPGGRGLPGSGRKGEVRLVNIAVNGRWLVDLPAKNAYVAQENRERFLLSLFLFLLSVVWLWWGWQKQKGRLRQPDPSTHSTT